MRFREALVEPGQRAASCQSEFLSAAKMLILHTMMQIFVLMETCSSIAQAPDQIRPPTDVACLASHLGARGALQRFWFLLTHPALVHLLEQGTEQSRGEQWEQWLSVLKQHELT